MNQGDLAVEKGQVEEALSHYGAAQRMFPRNLEMKFWHAVSLVNAGRLEESLPLFRRIFAAEASWATLLPRLVGVDLLKADEVTLRRILGGR